MDPAAQVAAVTLDALVIFRSAGSGLFWPELKHTQWDVSIIQAECARKNNLVYLVVAECRLILSETQAPHQITTSVTAPLIRVAAHHDPCPVWVQLDIRLHLSFTVLLHDVTGGGGIYGRQGETERP